MQWRQQLWLIVLAASALLWPAMLNDGPFWFPDTSTYIRGADAAVVTITGNRSEWSDRLIQQENTPERAGENTVSSKKQWIPSRPVLKGRSIYYGALIYLPMLLSGSWASIILQSIIVSGLITACLIVVARSTKADTRLVVASAIMILALFTPLPFYTSMLMPDVYSGVLILTLATTMLFWDSIRPSGRILLIGASAAIATFHSTHILIAAGVAGAALLLTGRGKARFRPILIALPVIVAGLGGEMAFSQAVKSQIGQEPLSPPFLSARITASGPGKTYLQHHCTGSPDDFELCSHQKQISNFSDDFLWSTDPRNGLFQLADSRSQVKIAKEDKAFFLAVLSSYPFEVAQSTLHSFIDQVSAFDLDNFNYSEMMRATAPEKLPAREEAQFLASKAFQGKMPVTFTIVASTVSAGASLIVLAFIWIRSLKNPEQRKLPVLRFTLLIFLGVLANAMICGAMSKPGARYQMRLIWLLPVAAGAAALTGRQLLKRSQEASIRV